MHHENALRGRCSEGRRKRVGGLWFEPEIFCEPDRGDLARNGRWGRRHRTRREWNRTGIERENAEACRSDYYRHEDGDAWGSRTIAAEAPQIHERGSRLAGKRHGGSQQFAAPAFEGAAIRLACLSAAPCAESAEGGLLTCRPELDSAPGMCGVLKGASAGDRGEEVHARRSERPILAGFEKDPVAIEPLALDDENAAVVGAIVLALPRARDNEVNEKVGRFGGRRAEVLARQDVPVVLAIVGAGNGLESELKREACEIGDSDRVGGFRHMRMMAV